MNPNNCHASEFSSPIRTQIFYSLTPVSGTWCIYSLNMTINRFFCIHSMAGNPWQMKSSKELSKPKDLVLTNVMSFLMEFLVQFNAVCDHCHLCHSWFQTANNCRCHPRSATSQSTINIIKATFNSNNLKTVWTKWFPNDQFFYPLHLKLLIIKSNMENIFQKG